MFKSSWLLLARPPFREFPYDGCISMYRRRASASPGQRRLRFSWIIKFFRKYSITCENRYGFWSADRLHEMRQSEEQKRKIHLRERIDCVFSVVSNLCNKFCFIISIDWMLIWPRQNSAKWWFNDGHTNAPSHIHQSHGNASILRLSFKWQTYIKIVQYSDVDQHVR